MEQRPSSSGGASSHQEPGNTQSISPVAPQRLPSPPGGSNAPMPRSPSKPQEQTPAPPPINSSAIRTMKSDLERLFKTSPPSVAQMITASAPAPVKAAAKKASRSASAYLVFGIALMLFLVAAGGAYYFRNLFFPAPSLTEIKKAIPPAPFFATESSHTIEIRSGDRQQFVTLMTDAMREFDRDGTVKRILVKLISAPDQRFLALSDFLDFYHITPPEGLLRRLGSSLMIFVYTTSEGTRLGLATRTNDPGRTLRDMLDWEATILADFKPLLFDAKIAPLSGLFEDRSYRNIDWRYLKLSSDIDVGIGYGIFPASNLLVITTSRGLMETVINRLFDAR